MAVDGQYLLVQFDDGPEHGLLTHVADDDYCDPRYWRHSEVHGKPPTAKVLFQDGLTMYTLDIPASVEGTLIDEDGDPHPFSRTCKSSTARGMESVKVESRMATRSSRRRRVQTSDEDEDYVEKKPRKAARTRIATTESKRRLRPMSSAEEQALGMSQMPTQESSQPLSVPSLATAPVQPSSGSVLGEDQLNAQDDVNVVLVPKTDSGHFEGSCGIESSASGETVPPQVQPVARETTQSATSSAFAPKTDNDHLEGSCGIESSTPGETSPPQTQPITRETAQSATSSTSDGAAEQQSQQDHTLLMEDTSNGDVVQGSADVPMLAAGAGNLSLDRAKTGRSSCKTCGQAIPKGELRYGVRAYSGGRTVTVYSHVLCFQQQIGAEYVKARRGKCRGSGVPFVPGDIRVSFNIGGHQSWWSPKEAARWTACALTEGHGLRQIRGLEALDEEHREPFFELMRCGAQPNSDLRRNTPVAAGLRNAKDAKVPAPKAPDTNCSVPEVPMLPPPSADEVAQEQTDSDIDIVHHAVSVSHEVVSSLALDSSDLPRMETQEDIDSDVEVAHDEVLLATNLTGAIDLDFVNSKDIDFDGFEMLLPSEAAHPC